ncbi:MAG: hypothetical protein ACOCVF_01205 [bacterium]
MNSLEISLENYISRYNQVNKFLDELNPNGSLLHEKRDVRLKTKREAYQTIINELKKQIKKENKNNKPDFETVQKIWNAAQNNVMFRISKLIIGNIEDKEIDLNEYYDKHL